jgi:hypothetical protein
MPIRHFLSPLLLAYCNWKFFSSEATIIPSNKGVTPTKFTQRLTITTPSRYLAPKITEIFPHWLKIAKY